MRIGFDAKRAFFNQRGLGNYSRDTIRILSSHHPEDSFFLFSPKEKANVIFPIASNCQVQYPSSVFYRKCPSLWRSWGINKDLAAHRLDIYHGLSHELPWGIEKLSLRTVVTMHDLIYVQYPHLYSNVDRALYRKKYFHSCRVADKIIAISQQTKRDLVQYIGIEESKIEVIYQGCHPSFLSKIDLTEKLAMAKKYSLPSTFILNVGTIEPRKNQLLILKAMAMGKIDAPLVILGRDTKYVVDLQRYIASNNLSQKVLFLTNVPMSDLPAIYQMATLFVYPSIFEGFGIPIVEAMTSEIPVITSKGSCFEETGGNAAAYISPDSVEELAFSIKQLLSDESRRNIMINSGKENVKRFSDEHISQQMMSVYRSLL